MIEQENNMGPPYTQTSYPVSPTVKRKRDNYVSNTTRNRYIWHAMITHCTNINADITTRGKSSMSIPCVTYKHNESIRTTSALFEMSAADFLRHTCTICGTLCRADKPPANHPKMRIQKHNHRYIGHAGVKSKVK